MAYCKDFLRTNEVPVHWLDQIP